MRPFWTASAIPPFSTQIRPSLTSFADDVCALIARLFAYVGTLALIAILAVHFWSQLPQLDAVAGAKASWSVADHSQPAFALAAPDQVDKSATYTILRHPYGGRQDIFSWPDAGGRPMAELDIYQLGDEAATASPPSEDLALRMPAGGDLEPAGVVESKFGTIALLRRAATSTSARTKRETSGCLGFVKEIDDPAVRISGWSCAGDGLPSQRSAVVCLLDRLTLLTSGNEPRLADLFARAELRRGHCAAGLRSGSGDWITDASNPRLRGAM